MTRARLAVVFWTQAARQVESAGQWWRENRDNPEAFSEELERTLNLIAQQPGVGLPTTSLRLSGVRRILLPRVGYFLFYRIAPQRRAVEVLSLWHALWHARRGSGPRL